MKQTNALILCLSVFFSVQTHGAGKWREKISRHLPWSATYKLKKWENQRRKQLSKKVNSMSGRELLVLDSELKSESHDIDTIEEMTQLTRKEIYTRISQNEQDEVFQILAPALKMRLSSILNDEKMAPHFFEVFQDAARGNPPRAYRNILKEFFFAHTDAILALDPQPEHFRVLHRAISSFNASIKILQEVLDRAESAGKNADTFLAAFDAVAIPHRKYQQALQNFFVANIKKLRNLLSPEQFALMDSYTNRTLARNAEEAIITNRSETPNAKNAWNYLRDIANGGEKLFVNFLKTWPQYLTLVNEQNGDGLLHLVARHGKGESSKFTGAFLLDAGLELEAKNKAGETALFIIGKRNIFSPLFDYLKDEGPGSTQWIKEETPFCTFLLSNQGFPLLKETQTLHTTKLKRPSIPASHPIKRAAVSSGVLMHYPCWIHM